MNLFSGKYKLKQKKSNLSILCLPGIVMAIIMSMVAAPAWATSPGQRHRLVNQEEGQQQPLFSTVNTTIQKKSLQHVFTLGKSFAVNGETLIVGTDGKEVKLKKMLVPCDVEIRYLVEKGVATAKRINIKRVASDAGWQWVSEHPE